VTSLLLLLLLLAGAAVAATVQVDGVALTQAFCSQCFGRVLAVNEVRQTTACCRSTYK
jgi:hypothetical protein